MGEKERRASFRVGRWRALAVLAVLLECAWPARAEDRRGVLRGPLLEEPTPPPRSRRQRARKEQAADIETGAIGREEAKPLVVPVRETAVRGTLSEDKGTTAISVGFAAGYTTNAGPSLDKRDSGVTRTTAEVLHVLERHIQYLISFGGRMAQRGRTGCRLGLRFGALDVRDVRA